MPRKLLVTILSSTIILAGCSSSGNSADSAVEPVAKEAETQQSETASPAAADASASEIHALGETVESPSGGSLTAYDYRVVTTPGGEREGMLEVKVCIGPPEEGYDGASVLTDFWSVEDAEDRRYNPASSYSENDEVSPILDPESHVAWNDCLRGWIVMDTDDSTNPETIRYFNSMSEDPGVEEIRWSID
ncbi:hypothetical protein [Brevibacterium casei]|uniref:hypothetical protein n=1 Tax=Brevibacterium casei TaxID=33889 RepID=UPI0028AD4556|nr:hypothetical protein [Brevibacterium casei]